MKIAISHGIAAKLLEKHQVTPKEVHQCFENRSGGLLEDTREQHRTDPPTQWFIGETNKGRRLKIVFVQRQTATGLQVDLRTAYEPNAEETRIYAKFG
ncbi:MAG TPA: hypothetical protein VGG49_06165 [Steroidobacteraceae bacterium]|jgi:uncharacterized DUF497 family protein